jgi:hypothetical protein
MEGLQLPHAKLLYIVAELFKEGKINESEKATIKGKIVSDEPKLFEILEVYEANNDENVLKDGLLAIVKPKEETNAPIVVIGSGTRNPQPQDEISSPLGNQLFQKKKQHGHQPNPNFSNLDTPEQFSLKRKYDDFHVQDDEKNNDFDYNENGHYSDVARQ